MKGTKPLAAWPFFSTTCPKPIKPSARPRRVPKVERGDRFGCVVVVMPTFASRGEAAAIVRCDCGHTMTLRVQGLSRDRVCKCKSARIAEITRKAGT